MSQRSSRRFVPARSGDPTDRLEAPLFQRPYVWNRERNWVPLWEAIETLAGNRLSGRPARPHFLGTIVLDQLKTAEISLWPDDEMFKASWLTIDFYKRLKRSKARMILEALEAVLYTEKTENVQVDRELTIEHLMRDGVRSGDRAACAEPVSDHWCGH